MDTFDYSTLLTTDIDHLRSTAARARSLLGAVTPGAIEVGEIIADAKEKLPHGKFGAWCIEALGIDRRRAQFYMNLAKFAKVHGREQIQKLPLKAANYVAARSVPASVAVEIMNLVAAGNIPTAAEIKNLVREGCQAEDQPGYGSEPDAEIEALSDLLSEALGPPGLIRLATFLDGATPRAARELGRKLKGTVPVDPGYRVAHGEFGTGPGVARAVGNG